MKVCPLREVELFLLVLGVTACWMLLGFMVCQPAKEHVLESKQCPVNSGNLTTGETVFGFLRVMG